MKFCLLCAQRIVGRIDKKFCNDQCRSIFNAKVRLREEKVIVQVNRVLKKNRSILLQFFSNGHHKTQVNQLKIRGYNFNYLTSRKVADSGTVYLFCYEYGYAIVGNDEVLILKVQRKYPKGKSHWSEYR